MRTVPLWWAQSWDWEEEGRGEGVWMDGWHEHSGATPNDRSAEALVAHNPRQQML